MGMGNEKSFSRKQVEQASKWVARHERGLSETEQRTFEKWLAESPEHEACFFEHQVEWASFDVMDEWKPGYSGPPNPDLFESRAKSNWKSFLVYGGMAAVVALGVWFSSSLSQDASDPIVAAGTVYKSSTYEKHFLEDGSSFYLLPDSEVIVAFSDEERNIEFVSGESHFTVAHDPDRPFVVHSDIGKVTALGTVFSVKQDSDSWEVFVTEGRVKVDESGVAGSQLPNVDRFTTELAAGEKVVQELSGSAFSPRVEVFTATELAEKLLWKDQMIDMVSAPLEEILQEFKRSGSRDVVIVDEELKSLRMTVAIKAGNLADFIDLLKLSEGISATDTPNGSLELSLSVN